MNRRTFLRGLGCGALTAGWARSSWAGPDTGSPGPLPSLAAEAARKGIRFGANSDVDLEVQPKAYAELFARQCGLLAPGHLSWSWVAPTPDRYDFHIDQGSLDFADTHGLLLTGAHLLWQKRTPAWFSALEDANSAKRAIVRHIAALRNLIHPSVFSWNAVNEAIKPEEGSPDGLRLKDPFRRVLGADYIEWAFHTARQIIPRETLLAYNDFTFEQDTPLAARRRAILLQLLDRLIARGAPIDAVGLQTHLKTSDKFAPGPYRSFLKEIAERGLKILITELDVQDNQAPAGIPERDRLVADAYRRILDVALDEPHVVSVVTWGLSDRYTWLNPSYDPTYGRADRLPTRPLPFDSAFQAKPAYWAILRALRSAPARAGA